MAVFNDFELTNEGINLLGQVSTGQPLIFTKIKLGDGNFIGNVKYLTDLFSTFKEVGISDVVIQEDDSINIKSEFSNDGFSTSKEWKEIGIFAKAGETGTEVLYSYSYALLTVETIPAETIPYRRDLNFRNYISDVTNVTYDITIRKDKYDFNSDVAMQSASYLAEGDRVNVWKTDSCQKRRVAIANDNGIPLNNGLYANLILDIQGKYDSSLATISKYVVPAINEIITTGGYVEITSFDTDLPLQTGYYEIVDADNNQYSIFVNNNLEILDNEVIKDIAGYARLQGVELPCKVAIRNYPTINTNTLGTIGLELESDFDNAGNTEGIKKLDKDIVLFEYGSNNKVVVDIPEDDSTKVLSAKGGKYLKDKIIGVNQTWQNVNSNRDSGVTYTNDTGKPIQVSVSQQHNGTQYFFEIDGASVFKFSLTDTITGGTWIIPNGSTYKLTGGKIVVWAELR